MKYAGISMHNMSRHVTGSDSVFYNLMPRDYISIFLQTLWTMLIVAEKIGISNNDMHTKNILLQTAPEGLLYEHKFYVEVKKDSPLYKKLIDDHINEEKDQKPYYLKLICRTKYHLTIVNWARWRVASSIAAGYVHPDIVSFARENLNPYIGHSISRERTNDSNSTKSNSRYINNNGIMNDKSDSYSMNRRVYNDVRLHEFIPFLMNLIPERDKEIKTILKNSTNNMLKCSGMSGWIVLVALLSEELKDIEWFKLIESQPSVLMTEISEVGYNAALDTNFNVYESVELVSEHSQIKTGCSKNVKDKRGRPKKWTSRNESSRIRYHLRMLKENAITGEDANLYCDQNNLYSTIMPDKIKLVCSKLLFDNPALKLVIDKRNENGKLGVITSEYIGENTRITKVVYTTVMKTGLPKLIPDMPRLCQGIGQYIEENSLHANVEIRNDGFAYSVKQIILNQRLYLKEKVLNIEYAVESEELMHQIDVLPVPDQHPSQQHHMTSNKKKPKAAVKRHKGKKYQKKLRNQIQD